MRRHVRDLCLRVLRPALRIHSPDPDYHAKVERLEALEAQTRRGEIILLYDDEVDLRLWPGIISCRTRRGQCARQDRTRNARGSAR